MKLTILGNNSAVPSHNRYPTAQILEIGNELFLIDCGEGTQMRFFKHGIKRGRISNIFISHLHGDHYFGLIGLLTSMSLQNRIAPINLYGPSDLKHLIDMQMQLTNAEFSFPLIFHPLQFEGPEVILETEYVRVISFPTEHKISCCGFKFIEKDPVRHLNLEAINQYNVPKEFYRYLSQGRDYIDHNNEIIKNDLLTFPNHPQKQYAFCADTRFTESYISTIANCDLIYHEATYLHQDEQRASERFHTTSKQAGMIAKIAQVKQLAIGHFSSKYKDLDTFLVEAKSEFENTIIAEQGLVITI